MSEDRTRDDTGRFQSEFDDDEIIEAISNMQPTAGTADIAEELGVTRQSADYRLRRLEEEGRIRKETVGRTLIWFVD